MHACMQSVLSSGHTILGSTLHAWCHSLLGAVGLGCAFLKIGALLVLSMFFVTLISLVI